MELNLCLCFVLKPLRKLKLGIFMGKFPTFAIKKQIFIFRNYKIITSNIASVIMVSVTIMATASVTYG